MPGFARPAYTRFVRQRHHQLPVRVERERGSREPGMPEGRRAQGLQEAARARPGMQHPAQPAALRGALRLLPDGLVHEIGIDPQAPIAVQPCLPECGDITGRAEQAGMPGNTSHSRCVLVLHLAPAAAAAPGHVHAGGRDLVPGDPAIQRCEPDARQPQGRGDLACDGDVERQAGHQPDGLSEQHEPQVAVGHGLPRAIDERGCTDGPDAARPPLLRGHRVDGGRRGRHGPGGLEDRTPWGQAGRVRQQLAKGHGRRVHRPAPARSGVAASTARVNGYPVPRPRSVGARSHRR